MCVEYVCSVCNVPDWYRCDSAWESTLHGARCEFLQHTSQRHKCTICRRVERVITKLRQLVFQEPWRLNNGPELQDWEKEGIVSQDTLIKSGKEESSEAPSNIALDDYQISAALLGAESSKLFSK